MVEPSPPSGAMACGWQDQCSHCDRDDPGLSQWSVGRAVSPGSGGRRYDGREPVVLVSGIEFGDGWRLQSVDGAGSPRTTASATWVQVAPNQAAGVLVATLTVLPDVETAKTLWQVQTRRITPGFSEVSVGRVGDESSAELSGRVVAVRGRVNNVLFAITGGSAVQDSRADAVRLARALAGRVASSSR
jgi:hypothetical protein